MTSQTLSEPRRIRLMGTSLVETSYDPFMDYCRRLARQKRSFAVEFTNTHVVTSRKHEPAFREITRGVDYFVPDGMPLIWCMNRKGARLRDRVYGPTFMKRFVLSTPSPWKHYFLGGWDDTSARLRENLKRENPDIAIAGYKSGRFTEGDYEDILREIREVDPDFIWVGLGTPKQQKWIHDYKNRIPRGVLFGVGFAFDVIAGTKKDAPMWMQRSGLTWMFRLLSEPGRLGPRYFKYNFLFLYYWMRMELFSTPSSKGVINESTED